MGKRIKTDSSGAITPSTRRVLTAADDMAVSRKKAKETDSLRPKTFNDYIGQKEVKDQILTAVQSALIRKTAAPHILFYGPQGLGKTTLARIVADTMGSRLVEITGPMIEKPGDIASVLMTLKNKDILFIDEIHHMDKKAEEMLYSAMEDYQLNITIGQSEQARVVNLKLPKFTLIGATTRAGLISAPLRDRFQRICRMKLYTVDELTVIAEKTAARMSIELSEENARLIAEAGRGTPRIVNRYVAQARDYATVHNGGVIDENVVKKTLKLAGIRDKGLSDVDMHILESLNDSSHPMGITTLSHILGEDERTIEEVYEPYLLMNHYIEKTDRGRIITAEGVSLLWEERLHD